MSLMPSQKVLPDLSYLEFETYLKLTLTQPTRLALGIYGHCRFLFQIPSTSGVGDRVGEVVLFFLLCHFHIILPSLPWRVTLS